MDIRYSDCVAVDGSKYVLVLVDQCTTKSFIYGMHGVSGADMFVKHYENISLMLVVSQRPFNANSIRILLEVK